MAGAANGVLRNYIFVKLIFLLGFGLLMIQVKAQLNEHELQQAILEGKCHELSNQLLGQNLRSEQMKFDAAICLFQVGNLEEALELFREVRDLRAGLHYKATIWEAKCLARLGNDSLAMNVILGLPTNQLNRKILADPNFEHLEQNDPRFRQLKSKMAPGFNLWTLMLGLISLIGFFVGILLLSGKSRFSMGEKWLAITVLATSVIILSYVLIWTGYSYDFPYLTQTWQFFTLLIGPSLYFYLKSVFEEPINTKQLLIHLSYPCLAGLASLIPFLSLLGLNPGLPAEAFEIITSPFLLCTQVIVYAVSIFRFASNEWQVDGNIQIWTKTIAWGMVAFAVAFLSYFVLVRSSFFNSQWDYAISLVMALGILTIAYMGLVQRRIFNSEPIGKFFLVKKYNSSTLTPSAISSIKKGLIQLLEEDKVFKENELRLDDLAAYLNINRHQMSQVINEQYGVNFFELINQYRIDYVKQLLINPDNDHLTILQLAYEAGFNNKVSFNRYFKKLTGMTPSAYRLKFKHERI